MRKPTVGIFCEAEFYRENSFTHFIMKLCYAYCADVVAFTDKDINEKDNTILAHYWTPDGIKSETTLMPHWVECGPYIKWHPFFRERCKIVDDCILSKKDVSDAMAKSRLSPYVIPTMYTSSPQKVFTLLSMWSAIIVKPLVGARGEDIITIEKIADDKYVFRNTSEFIGTFNISQCIALLTKLYNGQAVIVQPKMKFTNKNGQLMDFRINVTKGAKGNWNIIYMIARTARDNIVSNLSKGGYASLVEPTLTTDYGNSAHKILNTFKELAQDIPLFMEEISNCNMLSLGIDVGIDFDTLHPYIIEVNYVPQITFRGKAKYADNVAQYYAYLTNESHKENIL